MKSFLAIYESGDEIKDDDQIKEETKKVDDENKEEEEQISNRKGRRGKKKPKKPKRDVYEEYHLYADKNLQSISDEETRFWKKLIRKYLKPLEKDPQKEKQIEEDLIDLRNRVSLFVYLLNAIVVTVMFGLTQVNAFSSTLSLQFECYGGRTVEIVPIAVLFSTVFGLLLLIQFIGMLYHRFSTLIHVSASTDIFESDQTRLSKLEDKVVNMLISPEEPIQIAPKSTEISDKNRKQLDMNRTVIEDKHRSFKNLKEVVDANAERLSKLQGTLYKKHNMVAHKLLKRWQDLVKEKHVPTSNKPRFGDVVDFARNQANLERRTSIDLSEDEVKPAGVRPVTPAFGNRVEPLQGNSSSDEKSSPADSNA